MRRGKHQLQPSARFKHANLVPMSTARNPGALAPHLHLRGVSERGHDMRLLRAGAHTIDAAGVRHLADVQLRRLLLALCSHSKASKHAHEAGARTRVGMPSSGNNLRQAACGRPSSMQQAQTGLMRCCPANPPLHLANSPALPRPSSPAPPRLSPSSSLSDPASMSSSLSLPSSPSFCCAAFCCSFCRAAAALLSARPLTFITAR